MRGAGLSGSLGMGLPVLIAVVGLFALGLILPQLGAILLSVLLG